MTDSADPDPTAPAGLRWCADDESAEAVEAVVGRLRAAGCVFAEDEAALLIEAAGSADDLERMVARRVDGVPLEHILGWAEFAGLRIAVDPGVFVPRRRTELLVAEALPLLRPGAVVLDLCCGSGAVGAALAARTATTAASMATRAVAATVTAATAPTASDLPATHASASPPRDGDPGIRVCAADIDPVAVRNARRNIPDPADVFEGDLFDALPPALRGRLDVIVVNAPYVPTDAITTMPPEARLYEAPVALDGGTDGLGVQRRVAADAPAWLSPTGHLLIETSRRQAPATAALLAAAGLHPRIAHDDELDGTVVIGARHRTPPGSADAALSPGRANAPSRRSP